MPRLASNRLVQQLQSRIAGHFYGDTANLLSDAVTSLDAFGQPNATVTTTAIACSFTDKPSVETWKGKFDIEKIDAEIRFATPAPATANRIVLTGRWDEAAYTDSDEYEIIAIQDRGILGYLCALRKVEV